ncbi:F-box protein At3g07870-like isoform X1 [Rhododendron vialii]|uniref:F-box protein At3g07870-like isoform X1 n=1 Tax=Rhododendron vialii TaxID=182163 RepID=UPI00265F8CD8|nr:F-box protein At3g07870-like isoform X1 [Rhododendron vialii]
MAATTIADLPDDIICNILVRIPDIKSIIRCNHVCKTWRKQILRPYFAKSHSSRGSPPLSLMLYHPSDGPPDPAPSGILIPTKPRHFGILEVDNDNLPRLGCPNPTVEFEPEIYIPREGYERRVIGACNGLVCLCVDKDIVVCNPILQGRQPFVLPKLPEQPKWAYSRSRLGFGFSPLSDEYKVLRCNHETMSYREGHIISFEVCTLGRDDTWRSIGEGGRDGKPFPRIYHSLGVDFVYVNGALYWLGRDTASRLVLCYFDVENEELGSTPSLPCEIDGIVQLGGLDESLYLFDIYYRPCHVNVWVMRDYIRTGAWTLKWNFRHGLQGPIQPIKILKDGTVLMILFKYIRDYKMWSQVLPYHNPQTGLDRYDEVQFWTQSIALVPSFICPPWLL